MKVLPQALEIIFEVQRKRSNEKITRKKKSLPTYKTLFFFISLDLSYFQTSQLSYFLFILNDLKCFRRVTSSLQIILEL